MASERSREQAVLEARRAIACLFTQIEESVVKDVRAKVESAFAAYDTHDAALRQQLAEAERQRDAHADLACEWRRELGALRQQLEQSQQLVTDGQEAIGHWQGEYEQLRQRVQELEQDVVPRSRYDACNKDWLDAIKKIADTQDAAKVEIERLEGQLAAAQARIRELEQALRLHLAVAADDPILLTPVEQQVMKVQALYNELIMSVGKKYPGESRHQTALKYIQRAEQNTDTTAGQKRVTELEAR